MDANKVAIVERATEKTKKDENVIVGTVERMVDAIFGVKALSEVGATVGAAGGPRSGTEPARSEPSVAKAIEPIAPSGFDYALWGKVGVFSGVEVAALGGVFTYMASKASDDYKGAADAKGLRDAKGNFDTYNGAALGCYIAGGAAAATGAVLWILSATEHRSTAGHEVTISPVAGPGYGAVMAVGRW
ncbi:MAG: hypothetical protein HY897_06035 [Deltaproteobacteria bacterium]|nr:hypothetical protein [Deltaproteobacteria bacterium]